MSMPEVPTTTTTKSPITTEGRIPRRDYLEAVRISRMIEKRMEETEGNEDQRKELESSLD